MLLMQATIGGRCSFFITWYSPILTTRKRRIYRRMPTNSSGINRKCRSIGRFSSPPQWNLRNGVTGVGQVNTDSTDTILSMPIDLLFDYAGVHLVAEKANDVDISINFSFADTKQDWNMWVRRAVLNARSGRAPDAQLTVTGPKPLLAGILLQPGKASAILRKREGHARRRRFDTVALCRHHGRVRPEFQHRDAVRQSVGQPIAISAAPRSVATQCD